MPTKQKPTSKKSTQWAIVRDAAKRHGVPVWLLWGVYGAENSWRVGNGVLFGLIETHYASINRTVQNPNDLAENADIAAALLAQLKKENGSWAAAITAYSGNSYTISHPRELARSSEGKGAKSTMVDAPFHLPLPGPLDPGNIWEEITGVGGGIGDILSSPGDITKSIGEISKAMKAIGAFMFGLARLLFTPAGWLEIAKIGGGALILLWGLRIVIRESTGSDPVRVANRTVSKAAAAAATVAAVK